MSGGAGPDIEGMVCSPMGRGCVALPSQVVGTVYCAGQPVNSLLVGNGYTGIGASIQAEASSWI